MQSSPTIIGDLKPEEYLQTTITKHLIEETIELGDFFAKYWEEDQIDKKLAFTKRVYSSKFLGNLSNLQIAFGAKKPKQDAALDTAALQKAAKEFIERLESLKKGYDAYFGDQDPLTDDEKNNLKAFNISSFSLPSDVFVDLWHIKSGHIQQTAPKNNILAFVRELSGNFDCFEGDTEQPVHSVKFGDFYTLDTKRYDAISDLLPQELRESFKPGTLILPHMLDEMKELAVGTTKEIIELYLKELPKTFELCLENAAKIAEFFVTQTDLEKFKGKVPESKLDEDEKKQAFEPKDLFKKAVKKALDTLGQDRLNKILKDKGIKQGALRDFWEGFCAIWNWVSNIFQKRTPNVN
jgi:hypothetical protein